MKKPDLYGLILCGGKSQRMGFDKAFIKYHNKPQFQHLIDLLELFTLKSYISCTSDKQPLFPDYDVITDKYDSKSPINGILSAFKENPDNALLTIAVDMPLISQAEIKILCDQRDINKHATYFMDSEGKRPHPLFTIYEPKSYDSLLAFHSEGKHSPRAFLESVNCKRVDHQSSEFLMNVNTKEQLDRFNPNIRTDNPS